MAIDTNVRYSITVVDELGTETANTFYADVDGTQTANQLLAMWNTLSQKVDAVTSGQIIRGTVSLVADPATVSTPALKTAPLAGSRVEQSLIDNFSNLITAKRFGQLISALRDTLIVSGKPDLTPGGAISLLNTFLTTSSLVFEWANNNQQTLVAFRDAFISFRKRRRQLRASSFES